MLFALAGFGSLEIFILTVVGLLCLSVPVALVVLLCVLWTRFKI